SVFPSEVLGNRSSKLLSSILDHQSSTVCSYYSFTSNAGNRSLSPLLPRQHENVGRQRQVPLRNLEGAALHYLYSGDFPRILIDGAIPPEMHRNSDFGTHLFRHLSCFTRRDREETPGNGYQQDIDLAEHLQLIGCEQMTEVA